MKFVNLTVTGIDDKVDLRWVEQISDEYPWVEFGVLLSHKRRGTPRYPSPNWLADFMEKFSEADVVGSFSAHLCGRLSDRILDTYRTPFTKHGDYFGGPPLSKVFGRVQLNGFPETINPISEFNAFAASINDHVEVILPIPNQKTHDRLKTHLAKNIHLLHDCSRGRGVEPVQWPEADSPNFTGFAGGVKKGNINAILDTLCQREDGRKFWLDLESGARTDDVFDCAKVERIIKIAEGYYNGVDAG